MNFIKKPLNYLAIPISEISKKNVATILILYLSLILIASCIFGYLLNLKLGIYDENFNIIFKRISFSNGELIHNLYYNNEYYNEFYDIKFYLQKTPAIPLLIYYLSVISKNFYFIIISKNIIVYSIYFISCYLSLKSLNKNLFLLLILLIIPIFIPYNFSVSLNFVFEDSLIAIFLPCIFLLLICRHKLRYLLLGIFFFLLYFVKTSMFFVITAVPILIIILEEKTSKKYIPIIFSILAILIWGLYGLIKTNKFAILNTSSSINSFVMSFSYNENFHKYYPDKSTDLIPINNKIPNNVNNEWLFHEFYKNQNNQYLNENFDRYLKDTFIKLKFIFFGIKKDGVLPDKEGKFNNEIRISQIISKVFFNIAFLSVVITFFFNFRAFIKKKENIYFCSLVILNLIPHVIVWATSKHLVGIINICIIYLMLISLDKANKLIR